MNTCIKCGAPIPEGELFCGQCSMNALPPEMRGPAKPAKKPAVRKAPAHLRTSERRSRAPKKGAAKNRAVAVLAILLAVSLGLLLWQLIARRSQSVQLRLRQDALDEREAELNRTAESAAADAQRLTQLESELTEKTEALDRLETELADAQRSATQSEYDMTTQQTALEKAQTRIAELEETVDALQTENDELTETQKILKEESEGLNKKGSFMDRHVVFVENDGSNLYHHYGCSHFAGESFWAYSKRLAESHGYKPCPFCN